MRNKFIFVLGLTLLFLANAQTHTHTASEVVYTFTGDTLEGPTQLPAGFHTVALQNDSEASLDIMLARLIGDATVEEIVAAFQAVEQAFGGGDPVAAVNEALELGELWGGLAVGPGESSSVGIDVPEGRYAVVATVRQPGDAQEEEGPRAPASYFTTTLDVSSAAEATEAPQADQTVQMVDFAFALPADIQAGPQTWEVINSGEQIHHLVLTRLQDDKTMEDLQAFMEGGEQGEPPVDIIGEVNPLSSGVANYVNFDLTPGTYIALCFMPDHTGNATGVPHVALGMIQTFVINE